MAVDDATVAIGALVEVEDGVHAQVRQISGEFVQMFAAEYFFAFFRIGTAGHCSRSLTYSLFVRLMYLTTLRGRNFPPPGCSGR